MYWSQLIDFYLWMVFPPIGSKNPIPTQYTLHNCMLESVSSAKYLGVDISSDLSWDTHINRISKKANNTLGFLRRNIKNHSESLKSSAYLMRWVPIACLLRPRLVHGVPIVNKLIVDVQRLFNISELALLVTAINSVRVPYFKIS